MRKEIVEIVKALTKEENVSTVKGATVINTHVGKTTVTATGSYTDLVLTLDKDMPAFVADEETGEFVLSTNNVLFTSDIALNALLRRMPEFKFLIKLLKAMPEIWDDVLADAKVDVISEEVKQNEQYTNPFSDKGVTSVVKHNSVYSNPYSLTFGPVSIKNIKRYRKMQMELQMKAMMKAMAKGNSSTSLDDDDDDDDDD